MSDRATRPLSSRFVLFYAIAYLVMIGLMGVTFDLSSRATLLEDVDENLEVVANLARESLPQDPAGYPEWAEETFDVTGFRVTVIQRDGVVVADSHLDPTVMENHADRPEIRAALVGRVGSAVRSSASTGAEQRYLALPAEDDLVIRTSVATRVIANEVASLRRTTVLAALLVGVAGVGLILFLGRRLTRPITELTGQARAVADGETDVSPRRSTVRELDQLGVAISTMASRLSGRIAEVQAASATLEAVLGELPVGTVLVEGESVVYANRAARAILGSIPDSVTAISPLEIRDMVYHAGGGRLAVDGESSVEIQFELGTPARRFQAAASPVPDEEQVLLVLWDVTERERTAAVRRDFVANASHELKTPVATIISSAEALRLALQRNDPSADGFASTIEASASQLSRLVGDLLDLSRLENEELVVAEVRLDHLVGEEILKVASRADEADVGLRADLDRATGLVSRRDVAIAVRNLIDNAIRYSDRGDVVTVSVREIGDQVVVQVSDTGEGIPTRDLDRVFERFYRVDSARSRATGGTGLGLAIVKHVAESHGGSVELTSQLGVGSTFILRLPLSEQGESAAFN